MAEAASGRQVALIELVEAQHEYDAALAGLAAQRHRAGWGGSEASPLGSERSVTIARGSALVAARAFERAYDAMMLAQVKFERTLDLLADARKRTGGAGEASAEALARAERIVADGRARLLAAGEALGRAAREEV